MPSYRSVALLIETSNEYARGLLRGILRYQQQHERWAIDLTEHHRGATPPDWVRNYRGDGIIVRAETEAIAAAVRSARLPAVDVSAARLLPEAPWVETDDRAIAEAAVDHLRARGLSDLAYCGEARFNWSRWRGEAFLVRAEELGLTAKAFEIRTEENGSTWARERSRLKRWLSRLPEPCGLLASYDALARRVIDLCRELGREVPNSIAVMGVDNDPLLCQLASPPLTSVIPDAEGAGYQAAEFLDRVMSGERVGPTGTLLPPLGVAERRSTHILAVEDPEIARAARFILDEACTGIRVTDVVNAMNISRRVLETRFKKHTGKTPHELILTVRLEHAARLLRETTLTLSSIANRCGIEHAEYLSFVFRKHFGVTPGEYRTGQRRSM